MGTFCIDRWKYLQAEDQVIAQVQAEKDAIVIQVKAQMHSMQERHQQLVAELEGKLKW